MSQTKPQPLREYLVTVSPKIVTYAGNNTFGEYTANILARSRTEGDFTFKSRDKAARAEYELVQRLVAPGQKYDQADYDASPEKYTRFRTAKIAETLQTWSGFEVGQIVQIEFFTAQLNAVRGNAVMPVYKATLQGCDPEDFIMVYACVLQDFCL